ncbi:axoneme-associated protein mst101(2) [Pistacia vera]|uniref:axoneme-associated protein mst101(2) n=1 Tax=Pistacia vera TaxID=55513 RepID=UPI00126336DF|nr:axoneme-associated protein mst101(2) [Pistacia vera]
MAPELDVNGGEVSSPKNLLNGHANADGSYVFVNGNDAVSDDHVQTDLNSDSNSTVELTDKQSKTNNANDEGEKVEASEVQDSLIRVTEGDVDQENEQLESRLGDHGVNVECNLKAGAEMPSVNDIVVVNDLVDSNDCAPQPNESSEKIEISADAAGEIPVTDPPGELGPEAASGPVADANLETLVVSDPAPDETEHAQETVVVNDLVCDSQETTTVQLNTTSEIANGTLPDVPVSINETTTEPDAPATISETTTEPDAPATFSETTTEPPASTIDGNLASTETEAPKLDMGNMVDNEVENGSVRTDESRPETETGIPSMVSEEKASILTSDDSNLKSKVLEGVTQCVDSQIIPIDNAAVESSISGSEEKESSLPTCPGADVTAGSEIENISAVSCTEMPVADVSESEVHSGSVETTCPGADVEAGSEIKNRSVVSCTDMPVDNVVVSESEVLDPEVVHVENGGIQSTGEEVQDNQEMQFPRGLSEEIGDRTCPEVEEKGTGEEEAEEKGSEDIDVKIFQKVEEKGNEEFDDKTCQEAEENGSEEVDNKTCQEAEENRSEEIDEKTCQVEEKGTCQVEEKGTEEIDVKTCQEEEGRGSEKIDDKTGEIQFDNEGSDDKTCQEKVKIQEAEELTGKEKVEEVEGLTGEDRDDKICQVGEENENVEICFGDHGASQEVESIDGTHRDETLTSTPEGSTADASEMQYAGVEVVKRPFYFLVKVPRYDDENLREQIKSAQLKVDEKTQSRDVIRAEIQRIRDTYKKYGDNIEAAVLEEKAARELLKSKRQEIDSLQAIINKVKNAISVEDIDGRIRNMEHKIAHETLPLKEEKQFIRDIKQLKQLREQFSSSMGKQDDVQQAFDQKDQIEERLKLLRKEADSLRENVLKAEAATQAAKKKQKNESERLKKFYAEFNVADEIRQEAYKHFQSLRKQAYDKNKYFWKYKDDIKQVNDLLSKGDKEGLQHLCVNQVERVLELWNSNSEFRKEYVNSNIRSTLRRLKTLDGRSLGPDEEPPVVRSFVNNRVTKDNSVSQISTPQEVKTEQIVPVKSENKDDKPIPIVGEQKSQTAKSKRPAKPTHSANGLATVSGRDEIEEERDEEPKRTKEEEELARKAEELRKEEEGARLKEQRRLEEKVKAKEALERKKRIAEKAQARAVLRAQKEAEQKEKEKEKRARKKGKRKTAATDDSDLMNEGESAANAETLVETPQSFEIKEKSLTVTKRPQKASQFTKQSKAKSVPLPLRNRGKRRMQTWMWVVISALLVVALFLLGNSSFPSKFGVKGFGF